MQISVSIVEDDAAYRKLLENIIQETQGMRIASSHSAAETAMKELSHLKPHVALIDVVLPGISSTDLLTHLKKLSPRTAAVMMTAFDVPEHLFQSLRAGADGYLLKEFGPAQIIEGIREAVAGGAPMSRPIARQVLRHFQKDAAKEGRDVRQLAKLTPRERQVLEELAKGASYGEVAQVLKIGKEGVKTHIRNIYQKLHVRSKTEAILKFIHG